MELTAAHKLGPCIDLRILNITKEKHSDSGPGEKAVQTEGPPARPSLTLNFFTAAFIT